MIVFKVKLQPVRDEYKMAICPKLDSRHCDMSAFRKHPRYGSFVNSDLFPNILARIRKDTFGAAGVIRTDALPANVTVDDSGFLATVTISI